MKAGSYRDMQVLQEVAQAPQANQRDLSKRIGVALGLTNLILRRLVTKGYIKITGTKKNRILYLITPQGLLEKSRLTYEYVEYSLQHYRSIRKFLRERLEPLREQGHERILLYGTGELAEIAYLTIQEVGLKLVGIVESRRDDQTFLNVPIQNPTKALELEFDRVIIASVQPREEIHQWLLTSGVPEQKIIMIPDNRARGTLKGKRILPHQISLPIPSRPVDHSRKTVIPRAPMLPATIDVVVLCGGRGSRLGPLTADAPKPLLQVGGHPFLLHLLLELKKEGFQRFILAAHYLPEHFRTFLAQTSGEIPGIQLIIEPEPLGTGGALRHALSAVTSSTFVVLNGDSFVSQPLKPVLADHESAGRVFTVVAVKASSVEGGAFHKGVWRVGPGGKVEGFATEDSVSEGWVNAGIYLLDRAFVSTWPVGQYSLEANLPAILSGREAGVYCSSGRLLDIGTPEIYERAHQALNSDDESLRSMAGGERVHV